ncbi:MAG: transcriptional regulator with XRE-family HTH domain [Bacteriovoracaceae bacterium]
MDIKTKRQIKKWTRFFIEILEGTGLQKQEIADSLAVSPKTISNWLNTGEKGTVPRQNVFVRLAISCIRAKGLHLEGETIGGSAIAGALLGARFGGFIGAGIGAVIGASVSDWLTGHSEELEFIKELQELDRVQSNWQKILSFIKKNEELFPN